MINVHKIWSLFFLRSLQMPKRKHMRLFGSPFGFTIIAYAESIDDKYSLNVWFAFSAQYSMHFIELSSFFWSMGFDIESESIYMIQLMNVPWRTQTIKRYLV